MLECVLIMRIPCLATVGLLALLAPAAVGQDAVQLSRLASDQRLVAEQVRRLSQLLLTLEQRDRAEGRVARADLLGQAAARLKSVDQGAELASVIEGIAGDLAALRTGTALSAQADAIRLLEQLLEMLLETQVAAEQEQRQVDLEQHILELEDLRKRQEQLRQQNERLGAETSPTAGEADPRIAALMAELGKLAEQQRKLAEEIAKLGADRRSQAAAQAAEHAEKAAKQLDQAAGQAAPQSPSSEQPKSEGQQQPGQQPQQPGQQPQQPGQQPQQPGQQPQQPGQQPQQQKSAAEEQRQTEEALKDAIDKAKKELQQIKDRQRMQELENVRVLAEQILTAHRAEEDALKELIETRAESLTRAQRARLRQSSRTEQDLAAATQGLLVKIETLGASTFPFFLHSIEEDHRRLASEIGPPRLLVDEHALQVAADLSLNWESLIEAIRVEEERTRRKMEEPPGEQQSGEPQQEEDQPLVNFAMELQLLKRMQESLTRDLDWTRKKYASYARAGIEAEENENQSLQSLLDRQLELRRQFEDMFARMQEANSAGTEDL